MYLVCEKAEGYVILIMSCVVLWFNDFILSAQNILLVWYSWPDMTSLPKPVPSAHEVQPTNGHTTPTMMIISATLFFDTRMIPSETTVNYIIN